MSFRILSFRVDQDQETVLEEIALANIERDENNKPCFDSIFLHDQLTLEREKGEILGGNFFSDFFCFDAFKEPFSDEPLKVVHFANLDDPQCSKCSQCELTREPLETAAAVNRPFATLR